MLRTVWPAAQVICDRDCDNAEISNRQCVAQVAVRIAGTRRTCVHRRTVAGIVHVYVGKAAGRPGRGRRATTPEVTLAAEDLDFAFGNLSKTYRFAHVPVEKLHSTKVGMRH